MAHNDVFLAMRVSVLPRANEAAVPGICRGGRFLESDALVSHQTLYSALVIAQGISLKL